LNTNCFICAAAPIWQLSPLAALTFFSLCFPGIHILNTNCFICAAAPIWQLSPLAALTFFLVFLFFYLSLCASFVSLHCEFYIDINKCSCHRLPFHYVALFLLLSLHFFFVFACFFCILLQATHNALIRRGLLATFEGGCRLSIGSSWFLKNKLLPGERLL